MIPCVRDTAIWGFHHWFRVYADGRLVHEGRHFGCAYHALVNCLSSGNKRKTEFKTNRIAVDGSGNWIYTELK